MRKGHEIVTKLAVALLLGAPPYAGCTELAADSPFLANAAGAGGAPSRTGDGKTLELRGIMAGPDGTAYCIFDPQKGKSFWAGVGESGFPFVIVSADPETETATLRTGDGRKVVVALREAKIGAQGSKPYVAPAGPDLTRMNPEAAMQQQRNEQLREEMAQKRAEHLRAVKAGEVPLAPPPPATPPPG
jgi:hypothetical protein